MSPSRLGASPQSDPMVATVSLPVCGPIAAGARYSNTATYGHYMGATRRPRAGVALWATLTERPINRSRTDATRAVSLVITLVEPRRRREHALGVRRSFPRLLSRAALLAAFLAIYYTVMPPKWALSRGRSTPLIGPAVECAELDSILEALRHGESRSLVIRGEAGVGKTALLGYLTDRAADCRVISVTAVQSEMELAFAALHQLCAPVFSELELLPGPQREALTIIFGLHEGPIPDRFMVGLAVLSLLAEATEQRPLVCLVDDEQWLDRASAQVLAFVARRLGIESMALIFSARIPSDELSGLPRLDLEVLKTHEARALLETVLTGPVDSRVREEIIAETGGNPLALLELPRGLSPTELAGGFGFPGAFALSGGIQETFRRRISTLPGDARRLPLLAAAEPLGEPMLVWQAADDLGIVRSAANAAIDAELIAFDARVHFRHPLVRAAVYHSASVGDRMEAHRALAAVTDPLHDPDRRAWHRSQATTGPDEDVAEELERSANRAQARGGFAAASAFLERAAALTPDPARRSARALAAARDKVQSTCLDCRARASLHCRS